MPKALSMDSIVTLNYLLLFGFSWKLLKPYKFRKDFFLQRILYSSKPFIVLLGFKIVGHTMENILFFFSTLKDTKHKSLTLQEFLKSWITVKKLAFEDLTGDS